MPCTADLFLSISIGIRINFPQADLARAQIIAGELYFHYSTKSSNTRISINSCNLDNLLSFVKNAFAPLPAITARRTERDATQSLPQHMEALRADHRVRFSGLPRLEAGL